MRGVSKHISGLTHLQLNYNCIEVGLLGYVIIGKYHVWCTLKALCFKCAWLKVDEISTLAALASLTKLRKLVVTLCCYKHEKCTHSFTDELLEAVSGDGLALCACKQP